MSARVIPFRDPNAPLEGAARETALADYQRILPEIVTHAIGEAFMASCRAAGCGGLGVEDALPLFVAAMRRELEKSGY